MHFTVRIRRNKATNRNTPDLDAAWNGKIGIGLRSNPNAASDAIGTQDMLIGDQDLPWAKMYRLRFVIVSARHVDFPFWYLPV